MEYFCCYNSYLDTCSSLSDAEFGRLIRAAIMYNRDGKKTELSGLEGLAFAFVAAGIDRDRERYDKKCRTNQENGKRGGRPAKKTETAESAETQKTQRFPDETAETQETQGKDKDKDKDKGKGKDKDKDKGKDKDPLLVPDGTSVCAEPEAASAPASQSASASACAQIQELYNGICISFPKCTKLSNARKKAIQARLSSGYTQEDFEAVFRKAQASKFLKGGNNRNWKASFDWLLCDANFAKVLDGNYDDRPSRQPQGQSGGGNVFLELLREEEEKRHGQSGNDEDYVTLADSLPPVL